VSQGYRGKIFCTPATKELCSLVLPDSAKIQEEDARDANKHGYTKHAPALPLYTINDAERTLALFQPVGYNRPIPVTPKITVEFLNAGHLLGSAYARVTTGEKTILFGGDLGRYGRPVLPDPSPIDRADVLLVESTYGDRLHEPDDGGARLAGIVTQAVARGGKLVIPAFAIGRVEEVIYWIKRLEDEKRIPVLPVYIDSPMAAKALAFYAARGDELDPDMRAEERGVCRFCTSRMTTVSSVQQSIDLVASHKPSIVIASSGMATGGRVLYHLRALLPSPKNTVLFVGYQAIGTRGRSLVDGAKTIRLKGQDVPVLAAIEKLDSMSAHADAGEIMRWLSGFAAPPAMTYLVHGEPIALTALRDRIEREKQWPVHIAGFQERVEL
jgi:metallo-beta-lactamase family protein